MWALGAGVALVIVAGLALQFAISRNGPAVLSAVDRITGGSGEARLVASISTGDHPAQKLIVWGPEAEAGSRESLPVLVFVHGGSWRSGDPSDYGFIGRAFVPKGFVVVLAGYRLHPDGKYPSMVEDTAEAVAWTAREISQYGGDANRIVIAGHSAGAYNVVMTALEERWLGRKGLSTKDVAGVIGLSGPYDFYPFDSESTVDAFGHAAEPETTQPIAHVRADSPPALLIHGANDTLVRPRNSQELAGRMVAAGGDVQTHFYPAMEHNDPLISLASPWRNSRDVDETIAEFARSVTARDTTSVPVQGEMR